MREDPGEHRLRLTMTQTEAAAAIGVSPSTLRRWLRDGLVPDYQGEWTRSAVGKARLIGRLRDRGYTLDELRRATEQGRLAFGRVLELFDVSGRTYTRAEVARSTGLEPGIIDQLSEMLGRRPRDPFGAVDFDLVRYMADAIEVGLPLDALLQLMRVYIHAASQIADAEVRLVHMYVHEPLMRAQGSAEEVSTELYSLAGDLFPLASPLLERLHLRMLTHFIDQDVVGHMEADLDHGSGEVGRTRVAIAFADLPGYTELTEEAGDLHALNVVERFVGAVKSSLPDDARVIKTIGDAVMIVASDAAALAGWSVAFQQSYRDRPLPRIAVHHGYSQYRDGDYYGREVNLAARVAAAATEGQVLVTQPVVDAAAAGIRFELLPQVPLKGFTDPIDLFVAVPESSS